MYRYIAPFIARHVYGVPNLADPTCLPLFTVLDVHRNMYGSEEYVRARGALWHWDTGPPTRVKMLLYLTPVDREHACFVALRHNVTGLPLVMDGREQAVGRAERAGTDSQGVDARGHRGRLPAHLHGRPSGHPQCL